jgi:hypothetical protein
MHQLLKLTKAPEKEVAELKKLYDAQRNQGAARASATTPAPLPTLDLSNGPAKALKPWIEVALPHPDVIANRFKEAEFAADLFAVDAGHASEGYATPTSFFGITFLTEGLKRVLTSAAQRLADKGGDPVIGLQTAFGGGKTHTMLAIFHLAKHLAEGGDPRALPGLGQVLEKANIAALPKACRVRRLGGWARCQPEARQGTAGPHRMGLPGLAARWRQRAFDRRRSREGTHQPRRARDGRTVQARRPERDPAR